MFAFVVLPLIQLLNPKQAKAFVNDDARPAEVTREHGKVLVDHIFDNLKCIVSWKVLTHISINQVWIGWKTTVPVIVHKV